MQKKILLACVAAACVIAIIGLAASPSSETESQTQEEEVPTESQNGHVVLVAVSSSRPGCEVGSLCYIPDLITVNSGETVTWVNDDRAFHTVTAGYYDVPEEEFDSKYMNPSDKFSHTFSEIGTFHYYCRLHPWMEGTVTVQ